MDSTTPPDAQAGVAALNVWNRAQSLRAAQSSRNDARQRFTEREQALQQGVVPNYDVVTAQRALNDAQSQLLRAVLDYRKTVRRQVAVDFAGRVDRVGGVAGRKVGQQPRLGAVGTA